MRRIIPYIASDYRKDKIWLRRSRPSQRRYQVLVAIDDSSSMAKNHCGDLALQSLVLISRALARLEVGDIGIVKFGSGERGVETLHSLGLPFSDRDGPQVVGRFNFAQENGMDDRPVEVS